MTATLLRARTVQRLNSYSNPSSIGVRKKLEQCRHILFQIEETLEKADLQLVLELWYTESGCDVVQVSHRAMDGLMFQVLLICICYEFALSLCQLSERCSYNRFLL